MRLNQRYYHPQTSAERINSHLTATVVQPHITSRTQSHLCVPVSQAATVWHRQYEKPQNRSYRASLLKQGHCLVQQSRWAALWIRWSTSQTSASPFFHDMFDYSYQADSGRSVPPSLVLPQRTIITRHTLLYIYFLINDKLCFELSYVRLISFRWW